MGVKICLEVLRLVAADCTDSDFNSKVSEGLGVEVVLSMKEQRHNRRTDA